MSYPLNLFLPPLICVFLLVLILLYKMFQMMNKLLIALLCLELFSLILFYMILTNILNFTSSPSIIFSFLTLIVCEASIGLSLLVRMGRFSGNDLLTSYIFSLMKPLAFKAKIKLKWFL